jgi:cytochrome c oxidase subunit II
MMFRLLGKLNIEWCAPSQASRKRTPGADTMRNRDAVQGSALVAVLLSLFLLIFVAVTLYYFIGKQLWFPPAINAFGRDLDSQFTRTLIITGIVFFLSQVALAWAVFRYRENGGRAAHFEGNNTMEIVWTTAALVMFVGLGIAAEHSWADMHFRGAAPGAVRIEVTGKQFNWYFRYPGPDGQFGRTDPRQVTESNLVGLDDKDPAGKDDIVTATLAVPVNREVELTLRAQDVTHSFFVRELRLKQDAVPGMAIKVHFTAEQTGKYELVCAELCGLGHYRMRADVLVLPQAEYDAWLVQQKAEQ